MYSFYYFKLILFSYFINIFATVLNIDELNSIHYSIDIVNNPVLKNKEWSTDIVTVTNKHGQEYVCTLPEVQIPEREGKKEEDLLDQLVDISELLKPMEAAPCLVKKKDWWFYEFCYGSVIKQYHLEDNKVVGTILILGKYESEYNWRNNSKSKNKLQKFHTQNYVNGTRCDLTGEPRRAEVRFHCEEGVGDYIQQVDEPESCRYVIIIATTRVCHHPYLKPNPNKTPHNINCAPALTQDQFEHYQKLQEIKKLEVERERLKLETAAKLDPDSDSGEQQQGGGTTGSSAVAEGEADEESQWSIELVTIPISKKGRPVGDAMLAEQVASVISDPLEELRGFADTPPTPDAASKDDFTLMQDSLDTPAEESFEEGKVKEEEGKERSEEEEGKAKGEEEGQRKKSSLSGSYEDDVIAEKHFNFFRSRMDMFTKRWLRDVKDDDPIKATLTALKRGLDESVARMESKNDIKYTIESLPSYYRSLIEMVELYSKRLPSPDNLNVVLEYKRIETFSTLLEILAEAEVQSKEALEKVRDISRLEASMKVRMERMGLLVARKAEEAGEPKEEKARFRDAIEKFSNSFSSSSSSSSPPSSSSSSSSSVPSHSGPSPLKAPEDPVDNPSQEDTPIADNENAEGSAEVKGGTPTRNVKLVHDKSLVDGRKLKLEKSIKERLQKSGIDNIGRKIEVKILTPSYLGEDQKDTLSALSQEETEAFHNMIVNILSASAEEMRERKRHKDLESNYDFHLDEESSSFPSLLDGGGALESLSPSPSSTSPPPPSLPLSQSKEEDDGATRTENTIIENHFLNEDDLN